jgi:hypothetical protein
MKLALSIFLILIFPSAKAQKKIASTIDKRVEILSIVFRLAGNPEYNMKFAKSYVSDIHTFFDPYKNDALIGFAKELQEQKNMGFSKVMFLAVHLQFKKDNFELITESESNLKGKWDMADADKFVGLLNRFYHVSHFEDFFRAHQLLYSEATSQFNHSVASFDQDWYRNYYGDHGIDYRLVIGLANGGANYGPSVHPIGQKKLVYAVMGSWTFNEAGMPSYPKETYLSYLIHEFNHSFIDHILEDDADLEEKLKPSAEILLNAKRSEMKLEGYEDWHSLVNESLVRASVIRYMIDHKNPDADIQEEINIQAGKGFVWTKDLVDLLGEYESSRTLYPTFKSFYPRIYSFFNSTANHLKR